MKQLNPFIESTILNFTRKNKGIIHGTRALNERLPKPVQKKTYDFDIFMKHSGLRARQLERELDRKFNKNRFYTKKGEHVGTYKVIDKGRMLKNPKDDRSIADITRPYDNVPYDTSMDGIRYAKLSYLKKKIKKIVGK